MAKYREWRRFYGYASTEDGQQQQLVNALWAAWNPSLGKTFVITHIGVVDKHDKNQVDFIAEYTARGANSTDVYRRVGRTAEKAGIAIHDGHIYSIAHANLSWMDGIALSYGPVPLVPPEGFVEDEDEEYASKRRRAHTYDTSS